MSSTNCPASPGDSRSCQSSFTMTTGRAVARAQALDFDQREHAIGRRLARLDAQLLGEFLGDALGAEQCARQRAADVQHVFADWLRVEHRVVRHDVLDVGGRAANLLGNVLHARAGDVALLLLHQIERVENRRLALIGRIARDVLVELGLILRGVGKRLAGLGQLPRRAVELRRRVVHLWMKAHRSQSPITTSLEPMTATTSAMSPPLTIDGSA